MQKQTMFYQGQEVFLAKFDVIFKSIFIGEPELLASLLSKADNPKDIWMRFLAAEDGRVIEMLAEQNPVIEKAAQRLVYVSADEQVRYQMTMREKAELDYRSDMQDHFDMGKEEGINEGLQKGRYTGRREVAKKLLSMNMHVEQVADITGLTVADVNNLK